MAFQNNPKSVQKTKPASKILKVKQQWGVYIKKLALNIGKELVIRNFDSCWKYFIYLKRQGFLSLDFIR